MSIPDRFVEDDNNKGDFVKTEREIDPKCIEMNRLLMSAIDESVALIEKMYPGYTAGTAGFVASRSDKGGPASISPFNRFCCVYHTYSALQSASKFLAANSPSRAEAMTDCRAMNSEGAKH